MNEENNQRTLHIVTSSSLPSKHSYFPLQTLCLGIQKSLPSLHMNWFSLQYLAWNKINKYYVNHWLNISKQFSVHTIF